MTNKKFSPLTNCGRTINKDTLKPHATVNKKNLQSPIELGYDRQNSFAPKGRIYPGKPPVPSTVSKPSKTLAERSLSTGIRTCPKCFKNFNRKAYERHIEVCKGCTPMPVFKVCGPKDNLKAKELLEARTKYKPPKPSKPETKKVDVAGLRQKQEQQMSAAKVNRAKPKPTSTDICTLTYRCPKLELQTCEHCGRSFSQKVLERHVEYCKWSTLIASYKGPGPEERLKAKKLLQARTMYKPPKLSKVRNPSL